MIYRYHAEPKDELTWRNAFLMDVFAGLGPTLGFR